MTVSLEGIQKVYNNGFKAVNRLDLEIRDGEFFTLLGPSGCGKTTTLRMIAGLETATSGRIFIGGRDFTNTHPRDRDVAMVFQSYALYPHMTVEQNLALNLKVRKVAPDEIAKRLREVSRVLGIEQLLDRKPGQLSGGQRQRIALGRALIRRPNVFLMDEPLSNLDLKLREKMRTELKLLHARLPVTTVYVTHDQAEALVLSNRIGIMNAGDLLQVGTPQQIYDTPCNIFVARFVGTPSISLLSVTAEATNGGLQLRLRATGKEIGAPVLPAPTDVVAKVRQAGNQVALGVRPEAVGLLHAATPGAAPAVVQLIEPMGSVNHIILRLDGDGRASLGDEPLIALVRSNEEFAQGAPTWIELRPDRLVLFDAGTENALAFLSAKREWQSV
jgi:multiple sugar transport system ATP-binding protein